MKYQDYIVDTTRAAAVEFFRYAKAVPQDKLEWKPVEGVRSILEIVREVAMCPTWAKDILSDVPTDWSEEAMAATQQEMDSWKALEDCENQFNARFAEFEQVCKTIGDEKLSDTRWLPFDGGRDFTFVEMMDYPRWNVNYHLGQICYVQIAYGDKEMH